MNKLSLILIAGALAVGVGLVFVQNRLEMKGGMQGHSMQGMTMPDHAMRTEEASSGSTPVP